MPLFDVSGVMNRPVQFEVQPSLAMTTICNMCPDSVFRRLDAATLYGLKLNRWDRIGKDLIEVQMDNHCTSW